MITDILSSSESLNRNLAVVRNPPMNNKLSVRLVTLAGSSYRNKFTTFVSRMNRILSNSNIRIDIVQCTSSSSRSCYLIMATPLVFYIFQVTIDVLHVGMIC